MNIISEQELCATITRMIARYGELTLAEIKHRTRAFRRKRHIPNESLFPALEKFVECGLIKRIERAGHVVYGSRLAEQLSSHKTFRTVPDGTLGHGSSILTQDQLDLAQRGLEKGRQSAAQRNLNTVLDKELVVKSKESNEEIVVNQNKSKVDMSLVNAAFESAKKMKAEKERDSRLAANYVTTIPHVISEAERRENEKARRAERKQEVEDAANAKPDDIIASLDEPETNFGV